jgi:hypothetical protein
MSIVKQQAIVSARLRNQKLSAPTFLRPVDVVRWFGAVQAQDFHGAKWALALRMREATNVAVEEAFNRGEILRTHLLRPTWHFVAPDDIGWLLELTAPRINARCVSTFRKYELDRQVFKRSTRVLTNALKGEKHLTRAELKAALNRAGIAADDTVRFAHILLAGELDGVICSGPRRGNQFTYALLEERVLSGRRLSSEEALAELTRRYFASHGPATFADFVWWSGLTTNDARRGIASLDHEIEKTEDGETVYWSSGSLKTSRARYTDAHLLPSYDEYNVAYKNRRPVYDENGRFTTWDALGPTVLIGGRIVGTWSSTLDKKSVTIAFDAARNLNKNERAAFGKAAQRYADFLGVSLTQKFQVPKTLTVVDSIN